MAQKYQAKVKLPDMNDSARHILMKQREVDFETPSKLEVTQLPPQPKRDDFHDISLNQSRASDQKKQQMSEESEDEFKDLPRHERELLRFLKEQLPKKDEPTTNNKPEMPAE